MKTNEQRQQTEQQPTSSAPQAYEAPRITRKRSLERVTLGSGSIKPGGGVGGN